MPASNLRQKRGIPRRAAVQAAAHECGIMRASAAQTLPHAMSRSSLKSSGPHHTMFIAEPPGQAR
jgi:hypothetical protein